MTVLPARSIRAAPGGACTSPFRPTLVIFPFSTTNAEFSMLLPSPTISRDPTKSRAPDDCCDCDEAARTVVISATPNRPRCASIPPWVVRLMHPPSIRCFIERFS